MKSDYERIRLFEGIVDSHFHLYHMLSKGMDAFSILESCFSAGLEYAVDIGITPENFEGRRETAAAYPGLYTAYGYYPSRCDSDSLSEDLEFLEKSISGDPKAVAVGETGLDFYHSYGSPEQQIALLEKQISLADRLELPVIIHSRDAESETLEVLDSHTPRRGGVIHCFSYSAETALKFVDMGFYISFAGNVSYKKSAALREAAAAVPSDRLLAETDAPYLSPEGVRGMPNHPGYIGYTYECIAGERGIEVEELVSAVNTNFRRLFRIDQS